MRDDDFTSTTAGDPEGDTQLPPTPNTVEHTHIPHPPQGYALKKPHDAIAPPSLGRTRPGLSPAELGKQEVGEGGNLMSPLEGERSTNATVEVQVDAKSTRGFPRPWPPITTPSRPPSSGDLGKAEGRSGKGGKNWRWGTEIQIWCDRRSGPRREEPSPS